MPLKEQNNSMSVTTKIAVLMATFNGESYLPEQIDSILCQSNKDWELFIHDDGSTDKTLEIIKKYEKIYPDKIHILNAPSNGGAKDNFFYLMRVVDAQFLMFCDQDDVWRSDKIEKTLHKMEEMEAIYGNDKCLLVFSDLAVVDKDMNIISKSMNNYQKLSPKKNKFKDLMIQNVITGCTMMINRETKAKALLFTDSGKIIMHDWWCALVTAQFGYIGYIDESLLYYRQHGDNSIGAKKINSPKYLIGKACRNKEIRESLEKTQKQMLLYSHIYKNKLAEDYAGLKNKNKIQRLSFYFSHRIWMSGLMREIGLLIFG